MRQHLIELHIPGQEFGDFIILEMPSFGEPERYTQGISFDHFKSRELNRAYPDTSSGKLVNGLNWMQYARTLKYCTEHTTRSGQNILDILDSFEIDINNVPVCKGIWNFYDKIGYDYKKKKYL